MRYLLIAVLLVAVVTACHAEDAKTTKTEYAVSVDTTKINLGQQVDDVAGALKKHIDGPMGMYYVAAVRHHFVVGIMEIVGGLCLLVLFVPAFNMTKTRVIEHADPAGWGATAFGLACIGISLLTSGVAAVSSPQYNAMVGIIEQLGTIVK